MPPSRAIVLVPLVLVACSERAEPAGVPKSVSSVVTASEPVVGLPCEGCEEVFAGLPDELVPESRLAPSDEPGEPMELTGIVRTQDAMPAAGIIVYAYQTDAQGLYPPDPASRHGRLRAWCRTDEQGRYTFRTIRPGAYPGRTEPEHIHLHIIEQGRCTYYIDDVVFEDDPKLTTEMRTRARNRAGSGLTAPERGDDAIWRVTRDITLGENIPGYPPGF